MILLPRRFLLASAALLLGSPAYGCENILAHGGVPTASSANDGAFLAAAAASAVSGQACVYVPAGTYAFAAQVPYTLPNLSAAITIKGDGQNVTTLLWPSGGGIQINYPGLANSVHVHDLSVETGQTNAGTGIALMQTNKDIPDPAAAALSDITNVSFGGPGYWASDVLVSGVSNVNFDSDVFMGISDQTGIGVSLVGTAGAVGVAYNFTGDTFFWNGIGLVYGNEVQGVTVSQSNFTVEGRGIFVNGATGLDQLNVFDSQFQASVNAIEFATSLNADIHHNLFIVSAIGAGVITWPGVEMSDLDIEGNHFVPNAATPIGTGISLNGPAAPGLISGNIFDTLSTGIYLGASTTRINVQSNGYFMNTTDRVNLGMGNAVGGGSP